MKKRIALLAFVAVLIIGLVGCDSIKSLIFGENSTLYGKWSMEADVTEVIKEQLEASLNTTLSTNEKFYCYTELTLNKDGTYTYVIDKEKTEESMHKFIDDIAPDLEDYIYDNLAEQGFTKEEANGIFEKEKGMSIHDYVRKQLSVMELNMTASNVSGYYKADSPNLYFASSKEGLENCKDYYMFSLDGDRLVFSAGYGKYASDAATYPVVMPMEFHKN